MFANNNANTTGLAASLVACDGPCVFRSLHATTTAAGYYIMLFDSRSLPRYGDRPKRQWRILPDEAFDHEVRHGIPMRNGIVVALSQIFGEYSEYLADVSIDVGFNLLPLPIR